LGIKEINCKLKESYRVPRKDLSIARHLYIEGSFDFEKMVKANSLLAFTGRTLIDIGANYGSICIPAIKRGYFNNAIAIEPDRVTYGFLKNNLNLNNINSVKLFNLAIGDTDGNILFGSKNQNPGDSKVVNHVNKGEFADIYESPCLTLNTLLKDFNPSELLIWMDVQGFECHVLRGASRFITSRVPIVMEVFPAGIKTYSSFQELENLLSSYKYFANLRYDIANPKNRPISEFRNEYTKLESESSFTDFLFT
jgi:FkbM family methyltransferase